VIRRALFVTGALLTALTAGASLLATAWLAGYRVPIASGATYVKVQKLAQAHFGGEPQHGVVFVLLVGNDSRPGVGGARGDALHLLAVNPQLHAGTILDVPRDICTEVPGAGFTKINAANAFGGPRLQAQVISQLVGVPISYAVAVDFAGFLGIVDGAGGVTVDVQQPMHDRYSGAYFSPGPIHMNGSQALAYSRDRHDWARGDITRSENQGYLILSAIGQLQKEASGVASRLELVALLGRHAQLSGMGLTDLYRLGRLAYSVPTSKIRNVVTPVVSGSCTGGLAIASDAPGLFADLADDGVLESH